MPHREQSNELASSSGKSSQGTDSLGDKGGGEQKAQDEPECAEQQAAEISEPRGSGAEKTPTRPLPWRTWLAQKLYAEVQSHTICIPGSPFLHRILIFPVPA